MPVKGLGAVARAFHSPLCLEEIEFRDPEPNELLVRMRACGICHMDKAIAEAIKYLDIVGLKGRADLPPVKLSGGEQQRVAIARAMISQPDILIMDEPTASLDGDTGRSIVSFVKEKFLKANRCILIVTHDSRIDEFATRILHMEDGRLSGEERHQQ